MAFRRRTSHTMVRGTRRKLVWATGGGSSGSIANGAGVSFDLVADLQAAGSSILGSTIMRTHLVISTLWGAVAQPAFYVYAVKVSDANETAIALPNFSHLNWAIYKQVYAHSTGATVDACTQEVLDLRAKRKIQEMQENWTLFITNTSGVAQTYNVFSRTLVALP